MEKISIQELGDVFAARTKLSSKDAERLVKAMFSLIRDELAKGNPVKVRGLGTFKIIDVDPRESVNVTTGERIVIEGHEKLTFIPDATMKEIVNRPFSQFETVVLNDGVDFSDMEQDEDETDTPLRQEEETAERQPMDETVAMEQPEHTEHTARMEADDDAGNDGDANESVEDNTEQRVNGAEETDENSVESDDGNVDDHNNENDECDTEDVHLIESAEVESESTEDEGQQFNKEETKHEPRSLLKRTFHAIAWIFMACLLVYIGYSYGRNKEDIDKYVCSLFPTGQKPVEKAPTKTDVAAKPDSSQLKGKELVKDQAIGIDVRLDEIADTTPQHPDIDIYAERDARVRTGAYRIVGTDYEVSVKKGETVKRISDRAFGPDMECYVEVYNSVTSSTELNEGQKLKIPKLVLKKKKRK